MIAKTKHAGKYGFNRPQKICSYLHHTAKGIYPQTQAEAKRGRMPLVSERERNTECNITCDAAGKEAVAAAAGTASPAEAAAAAVAAAASRCCWPLRWLS